MTQGGILLFVAGASVAVQAAAAVVAWREMGNAGRHRFAWLCVSMALLLMVERRIAPLATPLSGFENELVQAGVGMAISLLMLAGLVGLRHLFTAMRSHEETLANLARTDSLTGLPNRREIMARLQAELERCRRTGRPVSLLMVDLDRFKSVNDRFGHAVGDLALQAVAAVGARVLRRIDSLGRIGGEEFLAVLPETDSAEARSAAERLRAAIAAELIRADSATVSITASVGVATCDPAAPALRPEQLIQAADAALYRAKQAGRDCVALAEAG